jgi:hypothetical protein
MYMFDESPIAFDLGLLSQVILALIPSNDMDKIPSLI